MTDSQQNPLVPQPASDLAPRQPTNLLRRGIDMADQLMDRLEALARAEESSPILKLRGTFFEGIRSEYPSEFGIPNKAILVDEHHVLIASKSCVGLYEWRTGTLKWRLYCESIHTVSLSRGHKYLFVHRHPDFGSCWDLRDCRRVRYESHSLWEEHPLRGKVLDSSPDETRILLRGNVYDLEWDDRTCDYGHINHIYLLKMAKDTIELERGGTEWGNPVLCEWKAKMRHDKNYHRTWSEQKDRTLYKLSLRIKEAENSGDEELVEALIDGWSAVEGEEYDPDWWEPECEPNAQQYVPGWGHDGRYADSIVFDWSNMTADCRKSVGEYFRQTDGCFSPDGEYIAMFGYKTDKESLAEVVSVKYGEEGILHITSKIPCLALFRSSDLTIVSETNTEPVWGLSFSQDGRLLCGIGHDCVKIWTIDPLGSLSPLQDIHVPSLLPKMSPNRILHCASDTKTLICACNTYLLDRGMWTHHLVGFDLTTGDLACVHELSPGSYSSQSRTNLIVCNNRVLFTDVSDTDVMLKDYHSGNILYTVSVHAIQ
jgi:hypothetical protein